MKPIVFENVSKKYSLNYGTRSLRSAIPDLFRTNKTNNDFWALKDVSFEVEQGEALGIIGPNGAGKSTILKLLSGITRPTSGRIDVNGKLSALIEIGAGFHPDLTGRENVYLNGSIMGLKRREIDEKFDSIVEFAELEKFIDVPIKRYSSGMYVRLGFAVAAHLNPDVLLIDEVLAVGDMAFKTKCYQKMREIKDGGKSIVFVSHDMLSIAALCERTAFLLKGEIEFDGDTEYAIQIYEKNVYEEEKIGGVNSFHERGTREIEIIDVSFWNGKGEKKAIFEMGEKMEIRLEFIAHHEINSPVFAAEIFKSDGTRCFGVDTNMDNIKTGKVKGGGVIKIEYEALNLQRGKYSVLVGVYDNKAIVPYDVHKKEARYFLVESPKRYVGTFFIPHRWSAISKT